MTTAVLYDIHGNLPALEAVLGEARRLGVDAIVVGGDVLPGPMPRECLAALADAGLPVRCIVGNGEVAALAELAGADPGPMPEQAREAVRWSAHAIEAPQRAAIEEWPRTLRLTVDGIGDVLFCHATPHSVTDIFTRLTPAERLRPIFDGVDAAVVVCGHTHMPFDRMIGRTRVVNAGSVGMPFGRPGASWLRLGPGVDLRHTSYDLDAAAARIRACPYPQAETFAAVHVLSPPSEADMLERLGRVALAQA